MFTRRRGKRHSEAVKEKQTSEHMPQQPSDNRGKSEESAQSETRTSAHTLAASSLLLFSKDLILSLSARLVAGAPLPLPPVFSLASSSWADFSSRASRRFLHSAKERARQRRRRREGRGREQLWTLSSLGFCGQRGRRKRHRWRQRTSNLGIFRFSQHRRAQKLPTKVREDQRCQRRAGSQRLKTIDGKNLDVSLSAPWELKRLQTSWLHTLWGQANSCGGTGQLCMPHPCPTADVPPCSTPIPPET